VAERYELIAEVQLSNSTSDELAYLFTAHGLRQSEASPEETEKLEVRRVPLTEAIRMAMEGEIKDVMSVTALLKIALMRK